MSDSSSKIYLVTGATRGIGLALVEDIATKDSSAIIYAGARDPINGALQLIQLAAKYPGRIEIVKYVAEDKEGNDSIVKEIGTKHGRVDTVIPNAAIEDYLGKIHEAPIDKFNDHFSVNTVGPIVLFQSIRDLLKASAIPRFIPISSRSGSLELISLNSMDTAPYGASKAALNWVTRKIHFENEWLIAFPLCPGPVDTDMAKKAAAADKTGKLAERFKGILRPADVVSGIMVDMITESTREKDGGQFHNIDGGIYSW